MNKLIVNIVFLNIFFLAFSQSTDEQLANYYYNEGDCKRAIPYLEKVYTLKKTDLIYRQYVSCLREIGDDKTVLRITKEQFSEHPFVPRYGVEYGLELEKQQSKSKGESIYQEMIDNLRQNPNEIINLQKAFSDIGKYDWAIKTLEKGDELMKGSYPFNLQYADIYGALNEDELMIKEYIDILEHRPSMLSTLKIIIPRTIDFEEENNPRFEKFQNHLIRKIQKNPNENAFSQLLIWALVQKRNFPAALIQAKGLDKRTTNDGREVYSLANQALRNKDFSTARNAYKYIVDLGESSAFFYSSQQLLLSTSYQEITSKRNFSKEQIQETINEYKKVLAGMPNNGKKIPVMRELAYIQAYFGQQPDEAIEILEEALKFPRYSDLERAKTKMLQADIRVLQNDVWEASLLYMQIEKSFKYESIGEEAKFKNARIFYYDGDFKFAQSQLDILKEATTRLIANDAMNLSILITDNLGLDSNYTAMRQFAKADLLLEQHRYSEAFQLFDSINRSFPKHNLTDDILMRRATAAQNQGKWQEAISFLKEIVEKHSKDVLADDALFQIATIYDNHLFDSMKAAEYYFQLMKDYPGSLFVTEARKAYRSIN
ncbi:MAG: tetratricopeptide repeat protein [Brumimicrobium sp.]